VAELIADIHSGDEGNTGILPVLYLAPQARSYDEPGATPQDS
jgi:hypothetical protein